MGGWIRKADDKTCPHRLLGIFHTAISARDHTSPRKLNRILLMLPIDCESVWRGVGVPMKIKSRCLPSANPCQDVTEEASRQDVVRGRDEP